MLTRNKDNWEATLYVGIAKNFGLKVNADSFENMALSVDFSIVRKVASGIGGLEALFFGQANLLSGNCEADYFKKLKEAYNFLKEKFKLTPISSCEIQFFRLRPTNFPTIRLSQLASLYQLHPGLFSKIIETDIIDDFYELLNVATSRFWETHYTFEKVSKKSKKKLTKSFVDSLLINTIIPLKFIYLKSLGKSDFSALVSIIEKIKPERNSTISHFDALKIKAKNAFETHGLLQMKNEYCDRKRCLECVAGKELITG